MIRYCPRFEFLKNTWFAFCKRLKIISENLWNTLNFLEIQNRHIFPYIIPIFTIFAPFESSHCQLSNGAKIIKIGQLNRKIRRIWIRIKSHVYQIRYCPRFVLFEKYLIRYCPPREFFFKIPDHVLPLTNLTGKTYHVF